MAVGSNENVVAASQARRLEDRVRVRELERRLGCKAMRVESLCEALAKAGAQKKAGAEEQTRLPPHRQ